MAEEYPSGCIKYPQPPPRLWLRGRLPPPGNASAGSGRLTSPERVRARGLRLAHRGLGRLSYLHVSGLALGADAAAHRAALSAGLHTIAIPGSGLADSAISPKSNLGLARDILVAGGALMSEHPPELLPYPHDFPSRNRLMVGMSRAVLVIEAGEKSGTLITARLATEYNRDLLCVPQIG